MRLAIIGASKGIGLATVKEALARGHEVCALSRSAAPLSDAKLRWISGDALDPATLDTVLTGADAVISTLGTTRFLDPKITFFTDSGVAALAALERAGLKRFICVTGICAGESLNHTTPLVRHLLYPIVLKRIYADKTREEAIIRASKADWTLVRPGLLNNGPRTEEVPVFQAEDNYVISSISRADVAYFLLDCAEKRLYVRQTAMIGAKLKK